MITYTLNLQRSFPLHITVCSSANSWRSQLPALPPILGNTAHAYSSHADNALRHTGPMCLALLPRVTWKILNVGRDILYRSPRSIGCYHEHVQSQLNPSLGSVVHP